MNIRIASLDDAGAVSACLSAAFEQYRCDYTPDAFRDTVVDLEAARLRLKTMTVFVTDQDGLVIGTLATQVAGDIGHLRGMAVHPEAQGRGVAAALLDAAEHQLKSCACARVTLDTTEPLVEAIGFYERRGYVPTGHIDDFYGMPLFEYAKQLPPLVHDVRLAMREDVPAMVKLLRDDPIGQARETVGDDFTAYFEAFDAIVRDSNHDLLVGTDKAGLSAMAQVTYTPGLSRGASWRATIESVRVRADRRRQGVGRGLMRVAIARAEARRCAVVQLTTDLKRQEAVSFYEQLGFRNTHAGMKLTIAVSGSHIRPLLRSPCDRAWNDEKL